MSERLKISLPIIVEGKYDKNILMQLADATVLTTGGFAIFNSKEQQALLRRLCADRGAILLTDSDGGGTQIRSFLKRILPNEKLYSVFIPQIPGKERRKKVGSKSGFLGVEGMEAETLRRLLEPFADGNSAQRQPSDPITKTDLFADGLTGTADASDRRNRLASELQLPADMTPTAFLGALNLLLTKEEYRETVEKVFQN